MTGEVGSESVSAASSMFDVSFRIPIDHMLKCFQQGEQAVLFLLKKARPEGSDYLIDVDDAQMQLEAGADWLKLALELEEMGLLISEAVKLVPPLRPSQLHVVGATLQVSIEGNVGSCSELLDFSIRIQ